MADRPAFESPVTKTYEPGEGAAVVGDREVGQLTLQDVSSMTKIVVRAGTGTDASRRLAVRFGAARTEGGVLISGVRPDEWMLLGAAAGVETFVRQLDRTGHVSVIDVTHGRALFRLTGPEATSVLEKLCNLDWADHMTPDDASVSGSVARVGCDIIRNDLDGTPSYLISCDRSYGLYLFEAILDAGHEFGIIPLVDPFV